MRKFIVVSSIILALTYAVIIGFSRQTIAFNTPVTTSHLRQIESLFAQNGLRYASVVLDGQGRVELRGSYRDSKEVDLAFSLAQTVVGVRWVSPVTPENIQVKEWEQKLSALFPRKDRERVIIDNDPPGPIKNKYAIIVGVGKFRESKITPLQFAEKDARDFYVYLIDPRGGNFKRENVFLLTNERATKSNIVHALNTVKMKAERDDLVILYFSSHGTPPDKFGGVHVVTYDSIVIPRHAIWESSITDDVLKDFIHEVKAKRLVVIMDACYSNGAYRQVAGFLPPGGKSLGVDDDEASGNSRAYMAKRILGTKDILLEDDYISSGEKAKDGWGRVLISASDAGQRSWESETLRNSFFTYYFIEGLRRHKNVKEAFEFAKPRVIEGVRREKNAEQYPQYVTDRREWNMSLGR